MNLEDIGYVATTTPQHIILIRLMIAGILGAVIGFEREKRNGSAGLRTHILIAVAACLFTTMAFEIMYISDPETQSPDPIRAVEAVTAGIAFLGAGAIFQQRGAVQGLTTGAGMWLAGALGVACAIGYYLVAIVVAIFTVIVLGALRSLSHKVLGDHSTEDQLTDSDQSTQKSAQERAARAVAATR